MNIQKLNEKIDNFYFEVFIISGLVLSGLVGGFTLGMISDIIRDLAK